MIINWFSSLELDEVSEGVLDPVAMLSALAHEAQIIWWKPETTNWPESAPHQVKVRRYEPFAIPWSEINSADATVYCFGDQAAANEALAEVARQHPGIVIFEGAPEAALVNALGVVAFHPEPRSFGTRLMQVVAATVESQPREGIRWVSVRAGRALQPWFSDKAARLLLPPLARAVSSLLIDGRGVVPRIR